MWQSEADRKWRAERDARTSCTQCGSPVPTGQGGLCSMCYGDIDYGRDGYYRDWAERQMEAEQERQREEEQFSGDQF